MTQELTPLEPLGEYLEDRIPGFGRLLRAQKFADGQSNPTYLLQTDAARFVLRAKPPGELLKSAHAVDREYRVLHALAETSVPVPRVFHLAAGDNPLGRMFYVMEWVEGRVFWDPALADLPIELRCDVYAEMNAVLASLHGLDSAALGLADFGKPGNYFARQTSRWIGQYRASALQGDANMDRLIDWLQENMPPDDGMASLVHGDWRLDNMIFDPETCRIRAVLDWELSTLGHPLADLAYQCMQLRMPADSPLRGLGGLDRRALGLPLEIEFVADYCAARGLAQIDNWTFCLAFSFFRLAAILTGVGRRARDGNASNPEQARLYGRAAPLLAEMAVRIIDGE